MRNLKTIFDFIIEDESGQGATEYILLVVVIVGIVLIFKNQIQTYIQNAMSNISQNMGSILGSGSSGGGG